MDKHIKLVKKYKTDPSSVTLKELRENNHSALVAFYDAYHVKNIALAAYREVCSERPLERTKIDCEYFEKCEKGESDEE